MNAVFENILQTKQPGRCQTDARELYPLLERIVATLEEGRDKTANSYLNAVLGEALDVLPLRTRNAANKNVTVQVLSWCAEHFAEDITEETRAALTGYFRIAPGCPPRQFRDRPQQQIRL